jgi:hypothetical protein
LLWSMPSTARPVPTEAVPLFWRPCCCLHNDVCAALSAAAWSFHLVLCGTSQHKSPRSRRSPRCPSLPAPCSSAHIRAPFPFPFLRQGADPRIACLLACLVSCRSAAPANTTLTGECCWAPHPQTPPSTRACSASAAATAHPPLMVTHPMLCASPQTPTGCTSAACRTTGGLST